jgi:serine/threonine-protein kinase
MKRPAEAVLAYQQSIDAWQLLVKAHPGVEKYRQELVDCHVYSGGVLRALSRFGDAVPHFRQALALQPKVVDHYFRLADTLIRGGNPKREDLAEAASLSQKAVQMNPKDWGCWSILGRTSYQLGEWKDAIAALKTATSSPKADGVDFLFLAKAHNGLGSALHAKGQLDEAIREYRAAIKLDPKLAMTHNNLGIALKARGQLEEAVREFRKAIELDPKLAQAHGVLGRTLLQLGRFAEARDATRRCLELLPPDQVLRREFTPDLRQCEELLALEDQLSAILGGKEKPAGDAQRLALARLCQEPFKKLYAASFRFYREAFANDPKLADDLQRGCRYNAACAAALAGCGQGQDAAGVPDEERARLRKQALDWLRADLDAWKRLLPGARPVVVQKMQHRLADDDFAGVRGARALAKLPEAERPAWQQLWADVAQTLTEAQGEAAPAKGPDTK